jgi:hypothetical protein
LATRAPIGAALQFGVTTPGFEMFVRVWGVVSHSTLWMQLPPLVASVGAVALVYRLARVVGCAPPAALVAGGIVATSPVAVIVATRVKPYSIDLFDCALVLMLAVRARESPSWRRATTLGAVAIATMVASASILPVGVVALAWAAWPTTRTGERRAGLRSPNLLIALLCASVMAGYALLVLRAVPPPLKEFWRARYITDASTAATAFERFTDGLVSHPGPVALVVVLATVGVLWARRDLAPLLIGPIVVGAALAVAQRAPFGGGRTDAYLYPCVAVAAAVTAQKVLECRPLRNVPVSYLAVAVAVGVGMVTLVDTRNALVEFPYPSADIGPLMRLVDRERLAGDVVVVTPFSRYPYAFYSDAAPQFVVSQKYSAHFTVVSSDPSVYIMPAERYESGYDAHAAVNFANGRARVWYIATDSLPSDTPPVVQAQEFEPEQLLLRDGYRVAQHIDVHGAHADLLVNG